MDNKDIYNHLTDSLKIYYSLLQLYEKLKYQHFVFQKTVFLENSEELIDMPVGN